MMTGTVIQVVVYVSVVTIGKIIIARKSERMVNKMLDTMYAKELEKIDETRKQELLNKIKENATK